MFRIAVIALSMLALFFLAQISQNIRPQSSAAAAPSQTAAQIAVSNRREQLINRVTQPYLRMVSMCDYLARFSYLVPKEDLPSKCSQLRAAGTEAIARMKTMTDLNLLSRQVDQFEITIAPELQNMEASYATAQRIMAK